MASRFWVGGTGTWDSSDTTHWAASTGAAGGQSVPGSSDTVTLDGASGGGTVTVAATINGSNTITSLTMGAFTGTLDFSANNPSITLQTWSNSGSGARTVNLGNGTWTVTGTGTVWNQASITNLTFNANSSVLTFTVTSALARSMNPGTGLNYSTITISANSSGGSFSIGQVAGAIATLNISTPNFVAFPTGTTPITNAMNYNGASLSSLVTLVASSPGATSSISSANNGTFSYSAFRDLTFLGGGTFAATNSIDLGHNSGITITAPSAGGGPAAQRLLVQRGSPY